MTFPEQTPCHCFRALQHSDLSERDVISLTSHFRDVTHMPSQHQDVGEDAVEHPLNVLLTTDAPLQILSKAHGEPVGPTVLIHYDLPLRKEDYSRRSSTILGSRTKTEKRRISISFIEMERMGELRLFEDFAERSLKEMPVNVADIFE